MEGRLLKGDQAEVVEGEGMRSRFRKEGMDMTFQRT